MAKNQQVKIVPPQVIAKYPNWTTLPEQPVSWIHADHRVETDIDATGVGRVRVKPGYNANIDEIRYGI